MDKKKSKVKKFFGMLGVGVLAFGAIEGLNALEDNDLIDIGGGFHIQQVDEVKNVTFENNILEWEKSSNAEDYIIKIGEEKFKTSDNFFSMEDYEPGIIYNVKIKATAKDHRDSSYVERNVYIFDEVAYQKKVENKIIEVLYNKYDAGLENPTFLHCTIENDCVKFLVKATRASSGDKFIEVTYEVKDADKYDLMNIMNRQTPLISYKNFSNDNYVVQNTKYTPLVGNLKFLNEDGWHMTIICSRITKYYSDVLTDIDYYENYSYIKCEKDGNVKYVLQNSRLGVHSSEQFYENFENGKYVNENWLQTLYQEYNNPVYEADISAQENSFIK